MKDDKCMTCEKGLENEDIIPLIAKKCSICGLHAVDPCEPATDEEE
jgi:hypothetical protein